VSDLTVPPGRSSFAPTKLLGRTVRSPVGRAYLVAAAMFVVASFASPGFAELAQIRFMLVNASFIGLVALGQTFVILGGGIDLSVPYVLNGAAIAMTLLAHGSNAALLWVVPVVLLGAVAVGVANGTIVSAFAVSPIIVTLATNVMIEGALIALTGGTIGGNSPHLLVSIVNGRIVQIPNALLIWVGLAALATVVLSSTAFGRRLYAVGTNPLVTRIAGVRHHAVVIATYAISALISAITGLLITGFDGQSYLGLGDPYLFASIAAVAVGGASVLGGSGNYLGTIAGTLILAFAAALLPIFNLAQGWLQVIYGVVIILTVGLASLEGRTSRPGR
jgi:ribose transport system permease protein